MLRLRRGAGRSEPPDPGEVLRRSIRERIAQCVGEEPGTVALDDAAIKEIESLQSMLRAYNSTQPRRNRRAWPVAALVVAVALSVWALLVVRVPATEASFALELSSVAFRVGRPPVLTARNDATGVDEIELTDSEGKETEYHDRKTHEHSGDDLAFSIIRHTRRSLW